MDYYVLSLFFILPECLYILNTHFYFVYLATAFTTHGSFLPFIYGGSCMKVFNFLWKMGPELVVKVRRRKV